MNNPHVETEEYRRMNSWLRVLYGAVAVVVVLIILAVWVLVYWLVRPYDDIHFDSFTTDKLVYQQGDIITLNNEFCWDGTPFQATREFQGQVSSFGVGYVNFSSWPPPGANVITDRFREAEDNCVESTIMVEVPKVLPPGVWAITYVLKYDPNPSWRTVTVRNTSNTFRVEPAR